MKLLEQILALPVAIKTLERQFELLNIAIDKVKKMREIQKKYILYHPDSKEMYDAENDVDEFLSDWEKE